MTSITLRPAREEDAICLAALSIETWLATYIKRGVRADFAEYVLAAFTAETMAQAITRDHVIVSDNEQGIDGYVQISTGQSCTIPGEGDVEIAHLYVQPRHQGRGVGPALLQAALEHCATHGTTQPWLISNSQNTRALAFYKAKGFVHVGTRQYEIAGQFYPNDILSYRG